jgi:hypothetical protein
MVAYFEDRPRLIMVLASAFALSAGLLYRFG